MGSPIIFNGVNAKILTKDILISNPTYNSIRVGNQFSHNSSTGVESGGILAINVDPTKFDLTAGGGTFIDYTVATAPTFKSVSWNAFTAVTVTGLTTQDETYILINNTGAIIQQSFYPTPSQRRVNIFIGRIGHTSRTTIQFATSFPDFSQSISSSAFDLFDALGPFNISGNEVLNNGANLTFQRTGGRMFFRSFNYPSDTYNPHTVTTASIVPALFNYRLRTGPPALPAVNNVEPGFYDVGGTRTAIPGGPNVSTIQRVYLAPNGVMQIQYGQTLYPNLTTATASIGTDPFIQNVALTNVTILIAYIVVRSGATALNNPGDAAILRAPKFETGVGGGVNTVTSLQQAYNSSVQPQIVLSTLGGLQVFDNATPIGGNLFQVANNAGTISYLTVSTAGIATAQAVGVGTSTNYTQIATPANPPALTNKVYVKADGKVYILDSAGLEQLVGPTSGTFSYTGTAGETLVAGEAVYIASTADIGRTVGQIYKLDASNAQRIEYAGIVVTGAAALGTATIVTGGKVLGLSGFLVGKPVFASTATPGAYQNTAPSILGQYIIEVGVADTASSFLINGSLSATSILVTEGTTPTTLQQSYNNSSQPQITLDATHLGIQIRDNSTPIGGGTLFRVTNNAGTQNYINVVPQGIGTTGGLFTGSVGVNNGVLGINGITSGAVNVTVQPATGNYNFNLPTTAGTTGQVLTSGGGGGSAMTWSSFASFLVAPAVSKFTAVGANTYNTPTSPRAPLYLIVRMAGGGGGGGGSGTTPGAGQAGQNTGFTQGALALLATGGGGGAVNSAGAPGGVDLSIVTGTAIGGTFGSGAGTLSITGVALSGGSGGNTPLGGAGAGGVGGGAGFTGVGNTGSGGGGAGGVNATGQSAACGGGSAGYMEAIIPNPSGAYTVFVADGGPGGTSTGGFVGGKGGTGLVEVWAYFQ